MLSGLKDAFSRLCSKMRLVRIPEAGIRDIDKHPQGPGEVGKELSELMGARNR